MSYINIIYKGNMVKINEQEIHLNYLMEEIAKVLLFINSALDFTKIISTMYTGLYINFFLKTLYGFRGGTSTVSGKHITEGSNHVQRQELLHVVS